MHKRYGKKNRFNRNASEKISYKHKNKENKITALRNENTDEKKIWITSTYTGPESN